MECDERKAQPWDTEEVQALVSLWADRSVIFVYLADAFIQGYLQRLGYLQEVGYTDTILDVKSQRVKALLGLAGDAVERPSDNNPEPMLNGTEPPLKETIMIGKPDLTDSASVLDTFNFLENAAAEFSDEDDDDDNDGKEKTIIDSATVSKKTFFVIICVSGEPSDRPNRSKLQDMLANLRDAEDLPSVQPSVTPPSRPSVARLSEHETNRTDEGPLSDWVRHHYSNAKNGFLVVFSPEKAEKTIQLPNGNDMSRDKGSVLCVVMSTNGEQCFSGGIDGTIQSWNTPNPNIDPYDSYDPSVLRGALLGHTDAVCGLVYSGAHQRLLSCSADGTVRLWNAAETLPALTIFNENRELGIPSSVDLVCSDPAHMVSSFNMGQTGIFNMETRQLVLSLESNTDTGTPCKINKVLSHPTLPITITAQEDRHIKFFDNNTGHDCSIRLWNLDSKTCIQEFTAHRKKFDESIHDVAFHPSKCYIASAGADALAKVFV
ncbi:UNVERIFIED_CONTAM: hypothetical protein FKN15_072183 [Acipenser sinensis]